MNCSTDGSCLAISALGSYPKSYVVGLHSDDWGLTWLAGAPSVSFDATILNASCGDTTHCMLVPVGSPTTPYEVITTSNAGATWQVSSPPAGWENMPTAVSCANANDCWIAMSTYDNHSLAGTYSQAAIEVTYDGGTTWSSEALPTTTPPIGDVVTLSCPPSGNGCIGIGNLEDHFLPPSGPRPPTAPLSVPQVISNLQGADQNG
jgi:Neuraminidase (sialidase)